MLTVMDSDLLVLVVFLFKISRHALGYRDILTFNKALLDTFKRRLVNKLNHSVNPFVGVYARAVTSLKAVSKGAVCIRIDTLAGSLSGLKVERAVLSIIESRRSLLYPLAFRSKLQHASPLSAIFGRHSKVFKIQRTLRSGRETKHVRGHLAAMSHSNEITGAAPES